jgi:hypothetical protein
MQRTSHANGHNSISGTFVREQHRRDYAQDHTVDGCQERCGPSCCRFINQVPGFRRPIIEATEYGDMPARYDLANEHAIIRVKAGNACAEQLSGYKNVKRREDEQTSGKR